MSLLEAHLEQIQLCASTISELPFAPPKIFTNALLHSHDITALIRDTETHERALFSLAPQEEHRRVVSAKENSTRRSTVYGLNEEKGNEDGLFRPPRKNAAVAAVLGGDMAECIKRERAKVSQSSLKRGATQKDEVDVELLLRGAERLCEVYPISGAIQKIMVLRDRYKKVSASIAEYEELVAEQSAQLKQMSRKPSHLYNEEANDALREDELLTEDDLRKEEEGVKELEWKKKTLEERVNGMEKDLGGILR